MLATIEFDDQLRFETNEIANIRTESPLASKSEAV